MLRISSMGKIAATWTKIASSDSIRRSSQVVGVVDNQLFIYGGELKPRQPVDNKLYVLPLQGQ